MGAVEGLEGILCKKCATDGGVEDKEQLASSLVLEMSSSTLNHPLSPAVSQQTVMVITIEPEPRRQEGKVGRTIGLKRLAQKVGGAWRSQNKQINKQINQSINKTEIKQCDWLVNLHVSCLI